MTHFIDTHTEHEVSMDSQWRALPLNRALKVPTPVQLISNHNVGSPKHDLLEMPCAPKTSSPMAARMKELFKQVASFGLDAMIGG